MPLIIENGFEIANDDAPDRWNKSRFPSYVRRVLGGISLFQFEKHAKAPSGWDWAIPYPRIFGWRSALWVKIDPAILGDQFVSVDALEKMCSDYCLTKISIAIIDIDVEAASLCAIPPSAIISAHQVGESIDWSLVYSRENVS